jgi:hypothetical protein
MKRGEGWMMRGIMQRSDADRRKEDMIWADPVEHQVEVFC